MRASRDASDCLSVKATGATGRGSSKTVNRAIKYKGYTVQNITNICSKKCAALLLQLCTNTLDTYLLASAEIACDCCEHSFTQAAIVEHKVKIETISVNMLDEIGLLNVTAAHLKWSTWKIAHIFVRLCTQSSRPISASPKHSASPLSNKAQV